MYENITCSVISIPQYLNLRWGILFILFQFTGILYSQNSFKSAPSATITGTDTICPGDTTWMTVTLTSGTLPWDFSYLHNADPGESFLNLSDSSISIPVIQPGIYTLNEIRDANGTVTGSGEAVISLYPVPKVSITGIRDFYVLDFAEIDTIIGIPGGGIYFGQGVFDDYFIPELAGAGTHSIVYAITTTDGCIAQDSMIINIWETAAKVAFENNDTSFCSNGAPFLVTAENVYSDTGSFSISGGAGLTDNGNNSAIVYPAMLKTGLDTITYSYSVNGVTLYYYVIFKVEATDISFTTQNQEEFIANTDNAEYRWIECLGNTILGNERTFQVPFDGSYALIVRQNGCIDTSECFIGYVQGSTGMKSLLYDNVRIYPNPTQGNIVVILNDFSSQINVEIADTDGSIVQKEIFFNQNELRLKMPDQRGVYIVKIITDKGEKLIKVMRN